MAATSGLEKAVTAPSDEEFEAAKRRFGDA